MKTNRGNAESVLLKLFSEYNTDKKLKKKLFDKMKTHGFFEGDINSWFSLIRPIQSESQVVLCLLSIYIHEITEESKINPDKYFTEVEIEEARKYDIKNQIKNKYPVVFKNIRKIATDHYIGDLTIKEVVSLYDNGLISYNRETQREFKVKEFHNKIVEEININKASVMEIQQNILDGKFITNFITLNILQNGEEDFEYDERANTLTVNSGEIDILDGFHRSLAMIYALSEYPECNYITGVNITNFDIDKARRYIVQEDKKNKMSSKYVKSLSSDNYSNMIVNKLNEDSRSYVRGKITSNSMLLKQNQFIDYNLLSDSIEYEFQPENTKDVISYYKRIVSTINYAVEEFPEILESGKSSYWWIGLIALIKHLGNNNKLIIETLSKSDKDFSDIKTFNRANIKSISNYHKSLFESEE
jgi:hypothetical protein